MNYKIVLRGHLDERWLAVIQGFGMKHLINQDGHPITEMCGCAADQSAFFGVLSQLRNLGVELISVISEDDPNFTDCSDTQ